MNHALDRLAEELDLASEGNERVRFEFGHACVLRVRHLLEESEVERCVGELGAYLAGTTSREQLRAIATKGCRSCQPPSRLEVHRRLRPCRGIGHVRGGQGLGGQGARGRELRRLCRRVRPRRLRSGRGARVRSSWSLRGKYVRCQISLAELIDATEMTSKRPTTIAEYIQEAPRASQAHLREVYAILKSVAPQAEEAIKWGTPFFVEPDSCSHSRRTRRTANFAPTPAALEAFRKELADHKTTKNFLQVPYDKPLPEELIRKIAEYPPAQCARTQRRCLLVTRAGKKRGRELESRRVRSQPSTMTGAPTSTRPGKSSLIDH